MTILAVRSTALDGHIAKQDSPNYVFTHDTPLGTAASHGVEIFVGQQFPIAGVNYMIIRTCLMFDTSLIPVGVIIASAVLTFKCGSIDWSTQDFLVTLVDGSVCADILGAQDYGFLLPQVISGGNQLNTAVGWVLGTVKTITLNAIGRGWIVPGGLTKLGLRSDRDINSNVPVGPERVNIISGFSGTEADRPLLTVDYHPGIPTVTTNPATEVT